MTTLHKDSLAKTLDSLAEDVLFGRTIPKKDLLATMLWICGRQGLPGAYAEMFAPMESDKTGIRLFTGESVTTRAGIAHQLGEEACRLLNLLGRSLPEVGTTLERAVAGMRTQLAQTESRGYSVCVYCCGTCAPAYWRNLATGLFPHAEERLAGGMKRLAETRAEDGQWKGFPFYFTSLALTEVDPSIARDELRHAAARWERILPRLERSRTPYAERRAETGRRLLALA